MGYEAMRFWLEVLQFVTTIGIGIFAWWRTRDKVADRRFSGIDQKLVNVDKDITEIKTSIKNVPVCGNHARMEDNDKHIYKRLDGIERLLSKMDGRLDGINRMVDLLTQNELSGGKHP